MATARYTIIDLGSNSFHMLTVTKQANGFNVGDFLLPRDTVHTREGFQILSKTLSNKWSRHRARTT